MNKIISILLLVLIMCSCQQNEEEDQDPPIVLDMTEKYEEISLDLEDLASDIRLVRLETKGNNLMRHFRGYVGDKCIISFDQEKILLFSAEGDFICIVSNKGKGPNEFNYIDALNVDENEKFLYFHDQQKNNISKYNLRTNSFGENIPLARKTELMSDLLSLNDTTLAILSAKGSNNRYLYFLQSTRGELLDGIRKPQDKGPRAWAGSSAYFTESSDNKLILQPHDSDTVFQVTGSTMKPVVVFHHSSALKKGDVTEGTNSSLIKISKGEVLFSKSAYRKKITPTSASYRVIEWEYLMHDITKNETHIVKIHWNFHGIEIEVPYLSTQNGKRFGIQWNAFAFKELLFKAMNENSIKGNNLESIRSIYNQISSEDNPVLLTGKWR